MTGAPQRALAARPRRAPPRRRARWVIVGTTSADRRAVPAPPGVPLANEPTARRAASSASRVFPLPPAPVSAIRRASRCASSAAELLELGLTTDEPIRRAGQSPASLAPRPGGAIERRVLPQNPRWSSRSPGPGRDRARRRKRAGRRRSGRAPRTGARIIERQHRQLLHPLAKRGCPASPKPRPAPPHGAPSASCASGRASSAASSLLQPLDLGPHKLVVGELPVRAACQSAERLVGSDAASAMRSPRRRLLPSPTKRSKRAASRWPGRARAHRRRPASRSPLEAGRALRNCETYTWTRLRAEAGGESFHRASTSSSTVHARPSQPRRPPEVVAASPRGGESRRRRGARRAEDARLLPTIARSLEASA